MWLLITWLTNLPTRLEARERGQGMLEYGLIMAAVAVAGGRRPDCPGPQSRVVVQFHGRESELVRRWPKGRRSLDHPTGGWWAYAKPRRGPNAGPGAKRRRGWSGRPLCGRPPEEQRSGAARHPAERAVRSPAAGGPRSAAADAPASTRLNASRCATTRRGNPSRRGEHDGRSSVPGTVQSP
jgi:hypothetical protein